MSDRLRRTWRYRLYPTRAQAAELERQLALLCRIYNAALEQRRWAWRQCGVSVGYRQQSRELTEARAEDEELRSMNALAQHEALRRLDRASDAFFRRVRAGESPGYPRFRSRARWDAITWAQYGNGCRVVEVGERNGRVYLQGVGEVKFRAHRPLAAAATLGQVTVTRRNGRWWLAIAVGVPAPTCEGSGDRSARGNPSQVVGLDVGVRTLATLSTGELIQGPHAYRNARRRLRRAQRKVSRRQRGSRSRQRARRELARAHERVAATRHDHHHATARRLVREHAAIAVEDLRTRNLTRSARGTAAEPGRNVRAKSGLNREILDQGWAEFVSCLAAKAEEGGTTVVEVDARGTSQECPACGASATKTLAQRTHRCACGLVEDRDVAAAQVIACRGAEKLYGPHEGRVEDAALAAPVKPNNAQLPEGGDDRDIARYAGSRAYRPVAQLPEGGDDRDEKKVTSAAAAPTSHNSRRGATIVTAGAGAQTRGERRC